MGNISLWQLLIVLIIIVLLFGTKKLRNIGGDLGSALKGFKKAVKDEEQNAANIEQQSSDESVADAEFSQSKDEEAVKRND